jgi:DNA-binding HxlR family transcriptional regulator
MLVRTPDDLVPGNGVNVIAIALMPSLKRLSDHGGRMTTRQLYRSGTFDEISWAWLKDSLRQMVERGWVTATQTRKNQVTYEITEAGYRALARS